MKRFLRALTIAVIAAVAAVACVFAFGCSDDNGNNKTDKGSDYNFTILLPDGKTINGQTGGKDGGKVATQICTNTCVYLEMVNIFPDENGKLSLSQSKVNELFGSTTDVTQFSFHVVEVPGCKADVEIDVNGKGDYTLNLVNA